MKSMLWGISVGFAINATLSIIISIADPSHEGRQFFTNGMLMVLASMHFYDWSKK